MAPTYLLGSIAAESKGDILTILRVLILSMLGFIPLLGLCLMPWTIETKGRKLVE
jgi:hypothetical protein